MYAVIHEPNIIRPGDTESDYTTFDSPEDAIWWAEATGADTDTVIWLYADARKPWTENDKYPDMVVEFDPSVVDYENPEGSWIAYPA
jgi:hypothetical protein